MNDLLKMNQGLKDAAFRLFAGNWTYLAFAVVGLAALGCLLGVLKLTSAEKKQKATVLGLTLLFAYLSGVWAWHRYTTPKIVTVQVIKTVIEKDYSSPQMNKIESARAEAERRALAAEAEVLSEQNARRQTEAVVAQARDRIAALEAKSKPVPTAPGSSAAIKEELRLATKEIDEAHRAKTLADVYWGLRSPVKIKAYYHDDVDLDGLPTTGGTTYHQGCSPCDSNIRATDKVIRIKKRLALAEMRDRQDEQRRGVFTAFGETKTVVEWAKDELCRCTLAELRTRIEEGWDYEKALRMEDQREVESYHATFKRRRDLQHAAALKERLAKGKEAK